MRLLLILLAMFPALASADVFNAWIAVSDTARTRIVERLTWDEETQGAYDGPVTQAQYRLFSYMQDRRSREALFKRPTIGGREYILFSVDFDGDEVPLASVRQTIDDLIETYPNQIAVMGAWRVDDGRQVGATYDENGVITSDGPYPPHAQLFQFMPDDPDGTPNPTVRDVNILYGQAPRDFQ